MSLNLGELVGTLRMDVAPFDKALAQGDAALMSFAGSAQTKAKSAGQGAAQGFETGLNGIESAAKSAGNSASAALGAGLNGAEGEAASAGKQAGGAFSEEFRQQAKDAGKVAGLAVGGALAVGVVDNLNVEAGRNKLSAQLGLTAGDAKVAGELAGNVYAGNFGESLGDVNDAVGAVVKNTGLQLGSVDIQPAVEKVLTLRDVFEQDLGMATAAAGQLVKTGMATDIGEALDIITVGLQGPANKADDLLEVFNEYGGQFEKLGIDGTTALGLLGQALNGGARDADIAADAFKEFSIRSIDGSDTTKDAFKALGLNAKDMQDQIAGGGKPASEALGLVLDKMRAVKDPAERAAIATGLFGTQSEDLGKALGAMDLSTAANEVGKVKGAADDAVKTMGSGAQATIGGYQRKLIDMGRAALESTGPTAAVAGAVAAFGPAALGVLGPIASLIAARGLSTAAATVGAGAEVAAQTATKVGWISSAATALASAASIALAWLIAIGPIALVIAAVVGLGILIYKNWDNIKKWTGDAWDWVVAKISGVPGAILGFFKGWELPGKVVDAFNKLKDGAVEKAQALVGWVSGLPGRLLNQLSSLAGGLAERGRDGFQRMRDGAEDKVGQLLGWVSGLPGRIVNNIGGVANLLAGKGRDVFQGLRDGAEDRAGALLTWVGGIPGKVGNAIGNVGGLLKSAGLSIVQGLLDGITEKFEAVINKVQSMTKWIKDNKGPKAYDLMLWRGPGNWIVQGLMDGLDDQMPALERKVGDVTGVLAGGPAGSLSGVVTASQAPPGWDLPAGGSPGTSPTAGDVKQEWNIYETTNPQATAAEVSRRQAFAGAGA